MAGRFVRPGSEEKAIRRRRGTSTSTTATRTRTTGVTRITTGCLECVRVREDDNEYACRKEKGTHAAVQRLQKFMRQATANDTRRAWFAQLDIRSFFPSIDRHLLLDLVHARMFTSKCMPLSSLILDYSYMRLQKVYVIRCSPIVRCLGSFSNDGVLLYAKDGYFRVNLPTSRRNTVFFVGIFVASYFFK